MIFQTLTTSFKVEVLSGVHDLLTDTIKLALYSDAADLGAATTVYSTTNETSGTGYSAGGVTLTGVTINSSNGVAYVNFDNAVWNPATFSAAGGLIYNASKSNKSIAVLSFGATKIATNTFTVVMPTNSYNSALIRFG
jgi:hypothetical protein